MSKHFFVPLMVVLFAAASFFPSESFSASPIQGKSVQPEVLPASPWVRMPPGARIAYIGIHGGTVPVSLLTSGDGSPMVARVGLTGSDFLHFMRTGGKPSHSPLTADAVEGELPQRELDPVLPGKNATLLMAGTAAGDVPVIYATGRSFEDMSLPANWESFGLTEKALAAEGAVKVVLPPKKKPTRRPRG